MATTASLHRIKFFEKQVHDQRWKDSMAGENEKPVIHILEACGYVLGKDFLRQHPIGERFVIDFAFVNEQIAIEVDGKSHEAKNQKRLDRMRDSYLLNNNWVPIRIKDKDIFGWKMSFYKSLIKEVVEERRLQWSKGELYAIDIPNFNQNDYE
jgi:very-short-patch-repair endonuclease